MTDEDRIKLRDYLDEKFESMGREIGDVKRQVSTLQQQHADIRENIGGLKAENKRISERVERIAENGHKTAGAVQGLITQVDETIKREDRREQLQEKQHLDNKQGIEEVKETLVRLETLERARSERHRSGDDDSGHGGGTSAGDRSDDTGIIRLKQGITLKDMWLMGVIIASVTGAVATAVSWYYSNHIDALVHAAASKGPGG